MIRSNRFQVVRSPREGRRERDSEEGARKARARDATIHARRHARRNQIRRATCQEENRQRHNRESFARQPQET